MKLLLSLAALLLSVVSAQNELGLRRALRGAPMSGDTFMILLIIVGVVAGIGCVLMGCYTCFKVVVLKESIMNDEEQPDTEDPDALKQEKQAAAPYQAATPSITTSNV